MRHPRLLAIACLLLLPSAARGQEPPTARAQIIDAQGRTIGEATFLETPRAGVWIQLQASNLPPGTHALHFHQTGRCEPPSFESAGGHYAPRNRAHGILREDGPHAGDMLNIHVPDSGRITVEQLNPRISLRPDAPNTVFDDDGTALVIHTDADDYRSQPTGDAGGRVACGVVRR